jgi:hypothetical protein
VRRLHGKLEMVEWLDFGIKHTHGDSAVSLCHDSWVQSKGTEQDVWGQSEGTV